MARQIAIVIGLALLIGVLAAVFFPVFAQAKQSAKKSAAIASFKKLQLDATAHETDAHAQLASYIPQARSVIRNGRISLAVKELDQAETQLRAVVQRLNGYIEGSDGYDLAADAPTVTVKLRVPADRFDAAFIEIEKLGRRTSKSIFTDDVTEEIVDMDARMKTMLAQEEGYRKMLVGAHTVNDSVILQDRLMKLREEIESIAAQRKSLAGQAEFSLIEVTLDQKANPAAVAASDPEWGSDAWGSAASAMAATCRGLGVVAIWLAVFSPIWALPALAAFALHRMRRNRQRQANMAG